MQIMVRPLPVPSQVAPGLPASFDAFWERAAARDPAQRFQSAKELAEALASAFGLAPVTSGRAGIGGPTPVPPTRLDPGLAPRSSGSFSSSPALAMGNDATMLPGAPSPSYPSGIAPAHAVSAPPEHTMSPASRTFAGAPAPKSASPVLLLAIGMIVGVAAVVGVALVALHGRSNAPAAETRAVATSAAPSEPAAPAPSVEPASAATAAAEAAPTASATAAAAAATTTPPPAPPPPPPHVVTHTRPPVHPLPPPPAPTRTGKVHIAPPAN
jgi:serine/threonine-protein kinase